MIARMVDWALRAFERHAGSPAMVGLRAENQAHHWGQPGSTRTLQAKRRLLEPFCPASRRWRQRTLAQGVRLITTVLKALGHPLPLAGQ
jgi:hypothetical protein